MESIRKHCAVLQKQRGSVFLMLSLDCRHCIRKDKLRWVGQVYSRNRGKIWPWYSSIYSTLRKVGPLCYIHHPSHTLGNLVQEAKSMPLLLVLRAYDYATRLLYAKEYQSLKTGVLTAIIKHNQLFLLLIWLCTKHCCRQFDSNNIHSHLGPIIWVRLRVRGSDCLNFL